MPSSRLMRREVLFSVGVIVALSGLAFALVAMWESGTVAHGATLTVTSTADGAAGSLRQAIADADSGDTIEVPAGIYTLSPDLGELIIDKDLTLVGAAADGTIIQASALAPGEPGSATHRVFDVLAGNVAISGVTMRHGNLSGDGGAIYNQGTLTLTNSTVSDNTARAGGGIRNSGAITLNGAGVTDNTASGPRGFLGGDGGGILNDGATATVTILDSTISGNTAFQAGGGIFNNRGTMTIIDSIISGNTTPRRFPDTSDGGGIVSNGNVTISNSTVAGNSSVRGGGIILAWAGGIPPAPIPTLTVINSTFEGNTAYSDGGAIENSLGVVVLSSSTIIGNTAERFGGGILNGGTADLTNSTISDNTAISDGGGIYSGGTLTVTNSTVSHNSASRGGGIFNGSSDLILTLRNSTISNNSASSDGGGIDSASGILILTNNTISGNTASRGGGINTANGLPGHGKMVNTIVAGNTATIGADCFGGSFFASLGYNLIGKQFGCGLNRATGDLVNVNPLLGPLADNGGPTQTHALKPDSPAIDKGNPAVPGSGGSACEAADQRGVDRPVDGDGDGVARCDIGAFEYSPRPHTVTGTVGLEGMPDPIMGARITFSADGAVVGGDQGVGGAQIEVIPHNPTPNDDITIRVFGKWRDGCVPRDPETSILGNVIRIDTFNPGEVCLQVISSYSLEVSIGRLPAGTYQVSVVHHRPPAPQPGQTIGQAEFTVGTLALGDLTQVVTDATGSFQVQLTTGIYRVTVEKDGFLPATMEGLEVDRDIALEVLLLAGDMNGDGVIDVTDLMVPAKNQGKTESPAVIKNAAECAGPGAITGNETRQYPEPPPMVIQVENRYIAKMTTNKGVIVFELLPEETPVTVNNFGFLSRDGFYNGLIFHRVIEDFMIQGGDPMGTGTGGPGYEFEDEIVPSLVFDRPGVLAMANRGMGTNSNGSQFFITVVPTPHLNGAHTIFGRVLQGQEVADAISKVPTGLGANR